MCRGLLKAFFSYWGIAFVLLIVLGVIIPDSDKTQNTVGEFSSEAKNDSASSNQDKPIEYKLAVINAERYVDENDITISRFRYLLDHISERTGESKEKIADMTAFAQKQLREKYGKKVGLLDLMEGANKALSGNNVQLKYSEIMAMMIVMLSQ